MVLVGGYAFWLLRRAGVMAGRGQMPFVIVLLFGAFALRLLVFSHETLDYQWFLARWVQHFRDWGALAGFSVPLGNYHVAYLYFLALFSEIPLPDLYLIKLLSTFFDVILAYYVMKLVGLTGTTKTRQMIAFFLVLYLPTVFLNGAYWGQCDSIYAAFGVMSVYFALAGKPVKSMIALGLGFSFKLQIIFIFPLYLVFLVCKKIGIRHLFVFPVTYMAVITPAILLGRGFWHTVLFYFYQAAPGGRGLNYNSPSIFALVQGPNHNPTLRNLGILAAFAFVFLVYLLCFARRGKRPKTPEDFLLIGFLFALGVPFFLPQMHDRYFFLADVFAVALGLARLRYVLAIPAVQFASLLGYHAYLRNAFFLPMRYGAWVLAFVLVALLLAMLGRRKYY